MNIKRLIKCGLFLLTSLFLLTGTLVQAGGNPPVIIMPPVNTTVIEGSSATFTVTATGDPTLLYQWVWFGTNVTGATTSTFTIPSTTYAQNISPVHVNITNGVGYSISPSVLLVVQAPVSQMIIGPSVSTTARAIALWKDTSAYKLINSIPTIGLNGNIFGVSTQSISYMSALTGLSTNGTIFVQQLSAPTAVFIGGTIGSITNHLTKNVNGNLMDYWSDGINGPYSKQLAP